MADHLQCDCKCRTRSKHKNRKCHLAKCICEVVPPRMGERERERKKGRSPERRLCDKCCHLLKSCRCRELEAVLCCCRVKTAKAESGRPVTLTESLPLYDENCHLLGYIQRGAMVDLPACAESEDPWLPSVGVAGGGGGCLPSCGLAAGARRLGTPARWTTRAAFRHASSPKSTARKCPCD